MRRFLFSIPFLVYLLFSVELFGQCPDSLPVPCTSPSCKIATSGTNVTVNAGEVLYVIGNYTSGTITMNGGTLNVLDGGTINGKDRLNPSTGGTINNCGQMTTTDQWNPFSLNNNITLNNYSNTTLELNHDNGFKLNNYAENATLNIKGNPNNPVTITNAAGSKLTVSSNPNLNSGSSVTNSGEITWTSSFSNFQNGAQITNNLGAKFNATNTSNAGNMNLNIINTGNMTIAANGVTLSNGSIQNKAYGNLTFSAGQVQINSGPVIHNWGTMSVYDFYNNSNTVHLHGNSLFNITHAITTINNSFDSDGCATVNLSGSGTIEYPNSNGILTNDADVNFCGKAPYRGSAESNPITNISNTNPMIVTMSRNQNGKIVNGGKVYILGVNGNSAASGYWTINNLSCPTGNNNPCTFELVGSLGTSAGVYINGGTVYSEPRLGSANYLGYDNCINPCPPLNVTFVTLKVIKNGDYANVLWATSSEKNSAYFIVERSYEGSDFEPIGVVDAAGNSSAMLNYSFIDTELFRDGIYYYRIKEVDLNNQSDYSNIASYKKLGNESVSIVQKDNALYIDNSESPNTNVLIYSVDGKLLYEKNVQGQHLVVDLSLIQSSAMYIVKVATSVGVHCEKFLK